LILVDTAVWVDHLRTADPTLQQLLTESLVYSHPMIIGELALGSLRERADTLRLLSALESLPVATHDEVLHLVDSHQLYGRGLGLVDAHLLASLRLLPGARLWTRDRRLQSAAKDLDVASTTPI
jgi:predicted nucleic acid-binding protein